MLVISSLITLMAVVMAIQSVLHVKGLRGGYGKGRWDESSYFMKEALEYRASSIFVLVLIIIFWVVYFTT